ncbi:MAG: glutathione S-transferase family protein [Alphaproteobacteria bacterium]|nr:glutathione S-transferase family protein [Alphaproteobacteria bacterium]
MTTPFTLHGDRRSGNCLKIKFVADHLGLPYAWRDVDVLSGETRAPSFLTMNPFGQVPVVTWPDGRTLAQSNAIIRYLARGSALLPDDPFTQAQIDSWLFWEQYSHEPYVAVVRFQLAYLGRPLAEVEPKLIERGNSALGVMEAALSRADWLAGAGAGPTIADVALIAYTRLAHEGGFELSARPNLTQWIQRTERALDIQGSPA